jgi:ribosomal protein L9
MEKQVSKIEFTANVYAEVAKQVNEEGKTFGSVVRNFVEVASKNPNTAQMLRDIRKAAKIGTATNTNVLKKAIRFQHYRKLSLGI